MIFKVREKTIVHEHIDDEVIIINMESGNYYSLKGSGMHMWKQLVSGADVVTIREHLLNFYEGTAADINISVQKFLEELTAEQIVESLDAETPQNPTTFDKANNTERLPFCEPEYEKYSDVQDLLLLDPIHDVSEGGWPSKKDADREKD